MANEGKLDVAVTTKKAEAPETALVPMLPSFDEFNRFLDRVFAGEWMRPMMWGRPFWGELLEPADVRLPSLDIVDRDHEILVRVEVPGVDKKDLDVSISGNVLTIKGSVQRERKDESERYHWREISRGSFSRSITLPAGVDASSVTAALKDGVLEVTAEKTGASKGRSVKVQ